MIRMQNNRTNPNWVVFLLSITPLFLLIFNSTNGISFILTPNTFLPLLGKILGLVGTILFSLSLILSSRLHFIEKIFNGLDKLYIKHSKIGQIALIMLLFHPIFLIPKYADNIHEAANFLSPGNNWANNWGRLSLVLMLVLIIITLYLRPKYNIWKFTHKFLTLAFFFASIHIWLVSSDTSHNLPLRLYMLTFIFLGILTSLYKTVFGKIFIKKYQYKITELNPLNNDIIQIKLKPLNQKISYQPGQFAFLNFKNHKIGAESHPFSFTSNSNEDYISFSIKNLGDFTSQLKDVTTKTLVDIEGPYGNFSYQNLSNKSQVWIGGGIGITPFISMAKSLTPKSEYQIELFYCVKNQTEAVHLEELNNIAKSLDKILKIIPCYSQQSGRFTLEKLKQMSTNLNQKELLICSPKPMIFNLKKQWLEQNYSLNNFHFEEFSL